MPAFLRNFTLGRKNSRVEQPAPSPDAPPPTLPVFTPSAEPFLVDPDSIPGFSPNISPPLPARLHKSPATRTSLDEDWLTWLGYSDATPPIKHSESKPSTAPSQPSPVDLPSPLDNQVRSFSSPTTRRQSCQDPPKRTPSFKKYPPHNKSSLKPPSSTSLSTLGSSYHSDKTRRTTASYGTPSTSASSLAPVTKVKVIDVKNPPQDSLDLKPPSTKTSHSALARNVSSSATVTRSPSNKASPATRPPPPTRHITIIAPPTPQTRTQRSATTPPTSYPERGRSTPSRHASTSTKPSRPSTTKVQQQPMRFDALRIRTVNAELCGAPGRKPPLIFTAMEAHAASTKPLDAVRNILSQPHVSDNANAISHSLVPSPPPEAASLELRRKQSASSLSHAAPQALADTPPKSPPVVPFEPEPPARPRKLSKGSAGTQELTRAKSVVDTRPAQSPDSQKYRVLTKVRSASSLRPTTPTNRALDRDPSQAGDPLLLDDDPFAKTEGVRVLRPRSRASSTDEHLMATSGSGTEEAYTALLVGDDDDDNGHKDEGDDDMIDPEGPGASSRTAASFVKTPPTPVSPEDYKAARAQRRGQWLEKAPSPLVAEVIAAKQALEEVQRELEDEQEEEQEPPRAPTPPPPTYFPIVTFMSDAHLLPHLFAYLSFSEWLALYSANKEVRALFGSRMLREHVLERFLGTVGYSRWDFEWAEPLALSLKDLNNYMRGVSMPTHEYARQAQMYLEPKSVNREDPSTPVGPDILSLALTTRAYTRVVLRLRAQAESEARFVARQRATAAAAAAERNQGSSTGSSRALPSRAASNSSRATSPSSSSHRSHSHTRHASNGVGETKSRAHYLSGCSSLVQHGSQFRSPLVKLHRAPLLRVFVPSPDGEWLSDASVLECEAELKRSGVIKLMRVGDVVWDAAVGDEGNLGRMVWDGSYLVDLDYKYSRIGELPAYFHSLAFTPSYFHRVIRTGVSAAHNPNGNPIVYVDVSPWGEELARNLQLLQDRSRTETPHGALHSVLRWVHRSSFTIRPPPPSTTTPTPTRVPIPNVEDGFFIDPGWYGTVVVEAEGTNEGLVDLQARCGPGAFPPRPETMVSRYVRGKEGEGRVWRVLRERSRPGEIWLRAVREKERVM